MISIFGVVSVIVALISVAIIVLHNKLMQKRTPVDHYFAALEDAIREKISALHRESENHPDSELHTLCAQCIDSDLHDMLKTLPEIEIACKADLDIDENEINQTIEETTQALNQAIDEYNHLITSNVPMKLMAQALTLTSVERIIV